MFKKTKDIDSSFRHIRLFSLLFLIANVITVCVYAYFCESRVRRAENRVLVLLNGKIVDATNSSRSENLLVEVKDHIRTFHEYFFTLSPDEKLIQGNITKALYLADGSAKAAYDNLKEGNYYSNIIAGNVNQVITVDSIVVNTNINPMYFRFYGKQEITRPTTVTTRSLVTEGYLRPVTRSERNSHGLLIEKWATLSNEDLTIKNR